MPNRHNIDSPITLVGFGRSGSSLLSNVFDRHPDVRFVGETTNLIFGSWYAVEYSTGNIPALEERRRFVPEDERAARVVRETFLTCFPDNRRYWFHKPIGVPTTVIARFDETHWSDAAEWFWKVMRTSFPKGTFFTLLRNPCDIVLSGKAYWGYDEATMWWASGYMAYLLTHPASPIDYAISYENLARNREEEVHKLFTYLDIPFHSEILGAFSEMHALARDREKLRPGVMTRRDQWSQLDPAHAKPLYVDALANLFAKYGQKFELPEHFTSGAQKQAPVAIQPSAPPSDAQAQPDQRQAAETLRRNQAIERLHLEYTKKAQDKERKFYNIRLEDRRRIEELEYLKLGIFDGRSNVDQRASAAQRGVIERQRRWINELVRANTWWQEQAVLWRAETERLTNAVHSQQNGLAGLDLDAARAAEERAALQAEQAFQEAGAQDAAAHVPARPAGPTFAQRVVRRAKRDLTRYAGRLRWQVRRFVGRQRS
jgi:hypothetical protein